eukprot:TRINITY_DN1936_c0_g1_i4.p1 TRINITY_DN1936_c0_g1~~TRINITY_DN1936_c0_g1_i4.p1  ORF type:complete len:1539 (-),score=493.87 TRINITY_DN1936_c0_g1_i4:80-4696(-)
MAPTTGTLSVPIHFVPPCGTEKTAFGFQIQVLLDLSSRGGKAPLVALKSSIADIYTTLKNTWKNSVIGLSSFVDYPTGSFGEGTDYPYLKTSGYLGLDANSLNFFANSLDSLRPLNGRDVLQSQLAALQKLSQEPQYAKVPNFGQNMRIALVLTDSPFHTNEDSATLYPSYKDLAASLIAKHIVPVFVVGTGDGAIANLADQYKQLVAALGFGIVVPVDATFSGLTTAISNALINAYGSAFVVGRDPTDLRLFNDYRLTSRTGINPGSSAEMTINLKTNFKKRQDDLWFKVNTKVAVVGWGEFSIIAAKDDTPKPVDQIIHVQLEDETSIVSEIITLAGTSPYYEPLTPTIDTIPKNGTLYQVSGSLAAPVKGAAITTPGTKVTDPLWRILFESPLDSNGDNFASFSWGLTDACSSKGSGTIRINVKPVEDTPRTECVNGVMNIDLFEDTQIDIPLYGYDPDKKFSVTPEIATIPQSGELFQYDESTTNYRGDKITVPGTVVTDPKFRVIYVTKPDSNDPASFSYRERKSALAAGQTLASDACVVKIEINPVNDPPVPYTTNPHTGNEDSDIPVKISCKDVDKEQCKIRITNLPVNGTIYQSSGKCPGTTCIRGAQISTYHNVTNALYDNIIDTHGWVIYHQTIATTFGLNYDNFKFDAIDPQNVFSRTTATAIIDILFVNDPPVTTGPIPANPITPEDSPIQITLTGLDEENGTAIHAYITRLPARGKLYQSTGTAMGPLIVLTAQGNAKVTAGNKVFFVPYLNEFSTPVLNVSIYDTFDYSVSDDNTFSGSETVKVIVTPVNDQPIATSEGTYIGSEDTNLTIALLGTDDYFGETPTILLKSIITVLPTKGKLFDQGKLVSSAPYTLTKQEVDYLPNLNENGEKRDSFKYQVFDGNTTINLGYSTEKLITITTTAVNDVPEPIVSVKAGCEDKLFKVCVSTYDPDITTNADVVSARLLDIPDIGTSYSINADGTQGDLLGDNSLPIVLAYRGTGAQVGCFLYQAAHNEFGVNYAQFSFEVYDLAQAYSLPLTSPIDILPVNDAPKAFGGNVTTLEDVSVTIDTLSGEDDPSENDAIRAFVVTFPAVGELYNMDNTKVRDTKNWEITDRTLQVLYVPPPNGDGAPIANFTFYVADVPPAGITYPDPPAACAGLVSLKSNNVTVFIEVIPVPDQPSAPKNITLQEETCENEPLDFQLPFVDPEGDAVRLFVVSLPRRGTLIDVYTDTVITEVPYQVGEPIVEAGSWDLRFLAENDSYALNDNLVDDNYGNEYAQPGFVFYDGKGTSMTDIQADLYSYDTTYVVIDVNPSNDPPIIAVNGNVSAEPTDYVLVDTKEYGFSRVHVYDPDVDMNMLSVLLLATDGNFVFRESHDNPEETITVTGGTDPVVEITTGRVEINGTKFQVNEILAQIFWIAPDGADTSRAAATITISADDFGNTGSEKCPSNSTTISQIRLHLNYTEGFDSEDYTPYIVGGALGAGTLTLAAGAGAMYALLRNRGIVEGAEGLNLDKQVFDASIDNPIYSDSGNTGFSPIYDGKQ